MVFQEQQPMNLARRLIYSVNQYLAYLRHRLKEHNLNLQEYPVLIYLIHHERENRPGRVSQRDIALRQHRDPALIMRASKSLAAKGYIEVNPDPDKKTRNMLTLTAEGRRLALVVDDLVASWEEEAMADLSPKERESLLLLLGRLEMPR